MARMDTSISELENGRNASARVCLWITPNDGFFKTISMVTN